nr:MAG TPA_asm: Geopilin domain 1 protein, PilA, bacterial nanowire, type [Caudoviricetes sp.]
MKDILKLILQIVFALLEVVLCAIFLYIVISVGLPLINQISSLKGR